MNNNSINAQDKLAKIRPLISMVRDEIVKIEPEKYKQANRRANDSFENKVFVYQTIQSEKAKEVEIQNHVRAGTSGFMYDLFVYDGKNSVELDDGKYGHLHKCCKAMQCSSRSQ